MKQCVSYLQGIAKLVIQLAQITEKIVLTARNHIFELWNSRGASYPSWQLCDFATRSLLCLRIFLSCCGFPPGFWCQHYVLFHTSSSSLSLQLILKWSQSNLNKHSVRPWNTLVNSMFVSILQSVWLPCSLKFCSKICWRVLTAFFQETQNGSNWADELNSTFFDI